MENNLVYNPKAIIEVTKEFTFDSAHFLKEYRGKCANLHGHTYRLQVTLRGRCNEIGMVVDFNEISALVKGKIIEKLDHAYLNSIFDFNTTAENMSVWIYDILYTYTSMHFKSVKVTSVKLWETPTSYVEYKGEC